MARNKNRTRTRRRIRRRISTRTRIRIRRNKNTYKKIYRKIRSTRHIRGGNGDGKGALADLGNNLQTGVNEAQTAATAKFQEIKAGVDATRTQVASTVTGKIAAVSEATECMKKCTTTA